MCIDETECHICESGYVLDQNHHECLLDCPSTQFIGETECLNCVYPCLECTDELTCVSCVGTLNLYSDSTCGCGADEYIDETGEACATCPEGCTRCDSATACTECVFGHQLDGGLCGLIACYDHCDLCESETVCSSCAAGYKLDDDGMTCVLDCAAGTFPGAVECEPCLGGCAECVNGLTCDVCGDGYSPLDGVCDQICSETQFKQGYFCSDCQSPCYSCSDETTCTSCILDLVLQEESSCKKFCRLG